MLSSISARSPAFYSFLVYPKNTAIAFTDIYSVHCFILGEKEITVTEQLNKKVERKKRSESVETLNNQQLACPPT
jgi:hypothetical protein